MTDNKEALPVVKRYGIAARPTPAGAYWEAAPCLGGEWVKYEDATAALSELRAEVERYKQARNDIAALHQAQTVNNQNYSSQWHEAIDAALEAFDAARSASPVGAAQGSAEGGV